MDYYTNLVERLRKETFSLVPPPIFDEAADAIEKLNASICKMEIKIEEFKKKLSKVEKEMDAAIFDLIRAEEASEQTYKILNEDLYSNCDYSLYLAIHNSVSEIINWKKDNVWRK